MPLQPHILNSDDELVFDGEYEPEPQQNANLDLPIYQEAPGGEVDNAKVIYLPEEDLKRSPRDGRAQKQDMIRYVPATPKILGERPKSSPPRPMTELEDLRNSKQFLNLEAAATAGSQLIHKADGKFDFDSPEGLEACHKFLQEVEGLFESFRVGTASRRYRENFSKAYKMLYQEQSLCYLVEILSSAQDCMCSC